MRAGYAYLLAAGLVLATVPVYRFILHHRAASASHLAVPVSVPVGYRQSPVYSKAESEADAALMSRRARCVAGVVYRTYDHVIEPWPGNVRCEGDPGYVVPR